MRNKWLGSLALVCVTFMQFSCGGCNDGGNEPEIKFIPGDEAKPTSDVNYNSDAMNEVIASFSSPVEMSALLKDSGAPFNARYLANPDQVKDYVTSFKKALGLGILSADLGYLNVYTKTSQILDYLVSIRGLTEDLKLGQFFDFQALKRLATSEDNIDSLQYMCVNSYQDMDEHLRNNQRSNLSALLVTGVWVESLYLITQVAKERPSDEFKQTIGEQKGILNNLLPILKLFKNTDKSFEDLVQNLEELKDVLDVAKITVHVDENAETRTDGVIVQNEYSVVELSTEELQEIISTTEKIRNKIVK
ncbi:MAG: hypothetical protein II075_10095 [Bacteroidales bacterium]|nr:hypothetical protein [Bacteroidales bacterium]